MVLRAQMLGFQQFADEKIAIVHIKGTELGVVLPQAFDCARAIHDIAVRSVGQELIDVIGPKGGGRLRTARSVSLSPNLAASARQR